MSRQTAVAIIPPQARLGLSRAEAQRRGVEIGGLGEVEREQRPRFGVRFGRHGGDAALLPIRPRWRAVVEAAIEAIEPGGQI